MARLVLVAVLSLCVAAAAEAADECVAVGGTGACVNMDHASLLQVVKTQRSIQASGRAPDIYSLDRAGAISHADRYMPYFAEVKQRVRELARGGKISYEDTVGLKLFVADRSGTCPISDASKLETRILFIRAGGDLASGTVAADDWLRLVQGLTPILPGFEVSAGGLGWVDEASKLKVAALEAEGGDPWSRDCGEVLATKANRVGVESRLALSASLDLTALNSGAVSYPGILLPDPSRPLSAFSRQESLFALAFDAPLKRSTGAFQLLIRPHLSGTYTEFYEGTQQVVNGAVVGSNRTRWLELKSRNDALGITNVQGSNGKWQTDGFASDLVANTFLATFLTSSGGAYVLDMSGSEQRNASELQQLMQAAVRTAPADLLRCRAYLAASGGRPQLSRIEVLGSAEATTTLTPADGARWELAKTVLHAMTFYVVESFHTGLHLYSHAVISSVQRAMPSESSTLGGVVDSSSVFVVAAILEQAAGLHSDHPSMWSGLVWNADIKAVRANTAAIARYYFKAGLEDILGLAGSSSDNEWLAGGAHKFVAPVRAFARSMAEAVAPTEKAVLDRLHEELAVVGVRADGCVGCPDVRSQEGLAKFYTNMLYMQSVFHGSLYHCREYISPLGALSTQAVLPALSGALGAASLGWVLDSVYQGVTPNMVAAAASLYGTGVGLIDAAELSDGPYFNSDGLDDAIQAFRSQVAQTRQAIEKHFTEHEAAFAPSFFFPKESPKPLGYGMTQTVYI